MRERRLYDWVIIGGGIQGCTVAVHLLKSGLTDLHSLCMIDSNSELLTSWKENTARTGMTHLRSPSVHHMDPDPFSLQKFAGESRRSEFYGRYKRPSLNLFNDHCDWLIKQTGLEKVFQSAKVCRLERTGGNYRVIAHDNREWLAKSVIVATGMSGNVAIPDWAENLVSKSENGLFHLLSANAPEQNQVKPPVVVTGGGISAVHTALSMSRRFPGKVTLLTRHALRLHDFDSSPGWLGPKYMEQFSMIDDWKERRKVIQSARYRGSVPPGLYRQVKKAVGEERLNIVKDEVKFAEINGLSIRLTLSSSDILQAFTVVLATGYKNQSPKPDWLSRYERQHLLSSAPCGTPIVNQDLEWDERLFMCGAFAELETGPTARNISGARKAAKRITDWANRHHKTGTPSEQFVAKRHIS